MRVRFPRNAANAFSRTMPAWTMSLIEMKENHSSTSYQPARLE